MTNQVSDLRSRLNDLFESFNKLGARLSEAVRGLLDEAIPPDERLTEQVIAARREFADAREAVLRAAREAFLTEEEVTAAGASLEGLRGLHALVDRIEGRSAEMKRRQERVLAMLVDVIRLEYQGRGELKELSECRARALARHTAIRGELSASLLPEIDELLAPENGFGALLQLVESKGDVDGETALQLSTIIEAAFGKRVTIEALLGRIVIGGGEIPPPAATPDEAPGGAGPVARTRREESPPVPEPPDPLEPASPTTPDPTAVTEPLQPQPAEPARETTQAPPTSTLSSPSGELRSTARLMAQAAMQEDPASAGESLRALLWQLLAENRPAVAWHLGRALERSAPELPAQPPCRLIRALALGRHIRYDLGEIAAELRLDLQQIAAAAAAVDLGEEAGQATNLLCLAAAMRPALLAPSTRAEALLAGIELPALPAIEGYRKAILDFAQHRLPLPARALWDVARREEAAEELGIELEKLARQAGSWLEHAPRIEMKNGMVKRVWLNWVGQNGRIASLLRPVRANDLSRLAEIRFSIERFASSEDIESAVQQTLSELRGETAPALPAGPLETITNHTRIGISFAQRWVALQESSQLSADQLTGQVTERAGKLRAELTARQDAALEELESLRSGADNLFLASAIAVCERTLGEIERLFSGTESLYSSGEAAVKEILNTELLQIPEIQMNLRWEPDGVPDAAIVRGIVAMIAEGRSGWKRAFELRKERGDLQALDRIIDILSRHPTSTIDIEELIAERNQQARRFQQLLQSEAEELRCRIEAAVTRERLNEAERRPLLDRIEQVEQALPKAMRFSDHAADLKTIARELESRFAGMGGDQAPAGQTGTEPLSPIERLTLDRAGRQHGTGTFAANGHAPSLAALPASPASLDEIDFLRVFFPEGLAQALEAAKLEDLPAAARSLLDEEELPAQLLRTLSAWQEARRTGRPDTDDLREICGFLGFHLDAKSDDRMTRHTGLRGDFLLTLSATAKHPACPVPQYGSAAGNRFRLLCLSDGESPAEMTSLIKRAAGEHPTIVFYFGLLNENRRREIAHRASEAEVSFLVLDDALLLHLCKLVPPRTKAFFHCTLPFSFLNPYSPDRPAAAELFHGRREELKRLLDLKGPCFVYGGRQVGKTSLLLEAQRRFARTNEHGEKEQLAIYLDLKSEPIEIEQPLDELFLRLCDRFGRAAGFDADARQGHRLHHFFTLLRAWLNADPAREALFLIDEADAFLRRDGNAGFARTARFRELLDEPDCQNRVKIVFAGNHDVLRAARTDNNPLAHHGAPICLGSLLQNNNDAATVPQLLEKTLLSIGYEFESPELVGSLLSHSDYFPSQVQVYAEELIRRIAHFSGSAAGAQRMPPRIIPAADVERLLADPDLRNRANQPFMQTLDLDARYLVLARIIAYHSEAAPLDLNLLRQQALIWQPEGFRNTSSLYEIRVLLEEMVELGVLRAHTGPNEANPRFSLRSPGLRSLFGSRDDLEAALLESHKLPPAPEFNAPFARLGYGSFTFRRSPLTMRQINELRRPESGVSLIFGCQATDLGHLHLFLAHRLERAFICVNRYATREDFAATLSELRLKPQGSFQLVLVPSDCAWDELWVADALKGIEALAGKDRVARVAFAADAEKSWKWLNLSEARKNELELERIAPPLPLLPWHDSVLRNWLEENGLDVSDDEQPAITDVTGNWPVALEKFQRAFAPEPFKWRSHLEALRFTISEHRPEIAGAFGLDLTEPGAVLRELARRERATLETLTDATGLPPDVVDRCLQWADLLGLIVPHASPRTESIEWRLASLVGRLLE
ncbi:MAG: AAA family ATPase [Blastocatellia bacterium]|nr:AAA family ATPase [Blastocatellia bacterium]